MFASFLHAKKSLHESKEAAPRSKLRLSHVLAVVCICTVLIAPLTHPQLPSRVREVSLGFARKLNLTPPASLSESNQARNQETPPSPDKGAELSSDAQVEKEKAPAAVAATEAADRPDELTAPPPHSPPPGMERCKHIVLFSAPRHGSTWLIDSVERCMYSREAKTVGSFSARANKESELWNRSQKGPTLYMSAHEASEYARLNRSVKVFPLALSWRGEEELREFVGYVGKLGLPTVFLTRGLQEAFQSWKTAKARGVWNSNLASEGVGEEGGVAVTGADAEEFDTYRNRVESFFEETRKMVKEAGVERVDEVDYDDVKALRWIVFAENGCYVENCNFVVD